MGIADICKLLEKHYPRYLGVKEISIKLNLGTSSVSKSLKSLRKREEIEYKQIKRYKSGEWLYLYRKKR